MIRRTFQLISGIGPWREKDLWARGIESWDAMRIGGASELPRALHDELLARIDRAEAALDRGDLGKLVQLLPPREHWRLWPLVADEALCLDIEAEDAGERHRPTVIGCLDGETLVTFIRTRDLDRLPERLAARRVWVTFNGASFDLPVLRRTFPELACPVLHLDLKPLCRRIGLGGGLKSVEDRLGIARPPHLLGRSGMDAVRLWRTYQATGDIEHGRLPQQLPARDRRPRRPGDSRSQPAECLRQVRSPGNVAQRNERGCRVAARRLPEGQRRSGDERLQTRAGRPVEDAHGNWQRPGDQPSRAVDHSG